MIRVNQAGACCALRLVPTLSRCSSHFSSDLLDSCSVSSDQGFEDLRWPVAQVTSRAAIANLPFGSGFGTFTPIYEQFAPRTLLMENCYVNHAHNDWLELWLTGGIPAIVLAVGFLAWLVASIFRLWKSGEPEAPILDLALAQAALDRDCVAAIALGDGLPIANCRSHACCSQSHVPI